MRLDAVILAGGRASRLRGVDKPGLVVGGRSLLEHAIAAAMHANARQTIVVGPDRDIPGPVFIREDPPFGGPVAAIAAALPLVGSEWTLLLASDLPRASDAVALLLEHDQPHAETVDGVALVDVSGHPQWLAGVYRTASLRRALDELTAARGSTQDASIQRLLSPLIITLVPDLAGMALDVDSWQDVDKARAREGEASGTH